MFDKGPLKSIFTIFVCWIVLIFVPHKCSACMTDVILGINPAISRERAESYESIITAAGIINNLNPAIIAAVIATESSFREGALGVFGEVGLMQLHPKWHGCDKSNAVAFYNILRGAAYIAKLRDRYIGKYGNLRYIEHYNRGINAKGIKTFGYYNKVIIFYRKFGGIDGPKITTGNKIRRGVNRQRPLSGSAYFTNPFYGSKNRCYSQRFCLT